MLPRRFPAVAGLLCLALVFTTVHLAAQSDAHGPAVPASNAPLKLDGGAVTLSELFGFERTAAISTQPVQNIARAASTFGQEDDITVLTLTLAGAPAHA